MNDPTRVESQNARRPIASLISKSETALQKLAPGTWQHEMLRDKLHALQIASALIDEEASQTHNFTPDALQEAAVRSPRW